MKITIPPLANPPDFFMCAPHDALAERDDASWFAERPLRSHRIRAALGAELTVFGKPGNPVHVAAVVVRQTTPGAFARLALWGWPVDLDADESGSWAVFDHTLRAKRGETMPIDWLTERVRALRQVGSEVVM